MITHKVYMYINYYTVYEVSNGVANSAFFIVLFFKYRKFNKEVGSTIPLLINEEDETIN